jgi:hypothetical protein
VTSIAIDSQICVECEPEFQPTPEHELCASYDIKLRRESSRLRARQHCGGDRPQCICLAEMPKAIRAEAPWAA